MPHQKASALIVSLWIISAVCIGLGLGGCKKKEDAYQVQVTTSSTQASNQEVSIQVKRYIMPAGVSDVYITCIEGNKMMVSGAGPLHHVIENNQAAMCQGESK